jgi:hypothetical protein
MKIVVDFVLGQLPIVVYVTVYEPTELVAKTILPVTVSIDKPTGVDEKIPPGLPVIVGVGLTPV